MVYPFIQSLNGYRRNSHKMFSWKSVLITIVAIFALKIWNPYFVENISWSWFDYLHSTHSVEEYNPESGLPEIILVGFGVVFYFVGKVWRRP